IAELLLEHITNLPLSARIIHKSDQLSSVQYELLDHALRRVQKHEPVQYIINESWFAGMRFYVDENVLIPRPETEELVHWVISECKSAMGKWPPDSYREAQGISQVSNFKFLDVGTGSGCIAIALKKKLSQVEMWACDISDDALNIARMNADVLNAAIDFVPLNFLDPEQREQLPHFDVIVSNPPYVPELGKREMKRNVIDFEPPVALFVPNNDALIFYKAIAEFAREKLNNGGSIYVEIHEDLGAQVKDLFHSKGFESVVLKKDLQGKERMIRALMNR
ncbi:MAG TPA: peptide chain release factor N(5)-glutamine methyltransferase, partial [Chitinophagaceae bacterium]|nr:peptide chain release factor N(5)-glutamine methyltransferase [Chitinophagaceae bacterium]